VSVRHWEGQVASAVEEKPDDRILRKKQHNSWILKTGKKFHHHGKPKKTKE